MTPTPEDRAPTPSSEGVRLIAIERERQVTEEGWTVEHDDEHEDESLAIAAACYALPRSARDQKVFDTTVVEALWPESWDWQWWKPNHRDRVRELVKAGALIAAEIDRLLRSKHV